MPVPSTVADLSSTASSNYPSGSESIGTSLDDYLRAHAAIIKQVSDAYIAADATKQDASTAVTITGTQTIQNKTLDSTNNISGASGHLAGFRNKIINGGFAVNQRSYASGAAVGAGLYGHDRWKMAASGDTYTFSTTNNKTTVTIPAGKVLQQVVEGLNLQTGTYTLSWEGTAQGKIGAGSYGASGITGSITGGTNTTIEFGPGTVANVQLEFGSIATPFEHRPYGLELTLCQRYYELNASGGALWSGTTQAGSVYYKETKFSVQKRAVPSITFSDVSNSGFPAGVPSSGAIATDMFWGSKSASASVGGGYFQFSWAASAEL